MKRVELEIEHHYQNKFVGRHRLKSSKGLVTIGSSRGSDIRLLGDEVEGVHANIEFETNYWVLSDMGSESGTWIRKQPVIEEPIKKTTMVVIGGHTLKLIPKDVTTKLFSEGVGTDLKGKGQPFHQVVIKKHGFVIDTLLLKASQSYTYRHGTQNYVLKAPNSSEWVYHEYGDVRVQQRLAAGTDLHKSSVEVVSDLVEPSMKAPLIGSGLIAGIVVLLMMFAPEKPEDDVKIIEPDKNQYTKLIYDADSARKRRQQAKKSQQFIKRSAKTQQKVESSAKAQQATAKEPSKKVARVVNKIRAAGLSQLIGKISQRAAKNSIKIATRGARPDSQPTSRALASLGKAKPAGAGTQAKEFKLKGVSTAGKGGGSQSYKKVGGLVAASVGSANVGILEEETEVQGGLARDVIAKVIEQNLGQVRYCYERQLSANPDLYGKVLVKFTIGGTGSVTQQKIGTTSLKNAMVEGCILRRVARWKFPSPDGGTSVIVSYPFLFKSTN